MAQMPKKLCLVGGDMGRGTVESKHEIISFLRNFMIQYGKFRSPGYPPWILDRA